MHRQEEEHYLLEAINSLQRELVVISTDFRILAANEFAKEKYGQNIVGRLCHELSIGPCKRLETCPVFGRACQQENIEAMQNGLDLEDGGTCYGLFAGGHMEGVVRLDFDPPKMGRLERKLTRSNAFLRNLINSSVDAVIAADMTGAILIFNDAASEVLGYSREEALRGLHIWDIYPGDEAREVIRMLRSEEKGGRGKLKAWQVTAVAKDGSEIPISLDASVIYENGQEVATIGFFHDQRETLRMEQELEETRLQLFQSSKMAALGKLAAGVAHQINNPLGGISLFAQLIMEEYELEEGAKKDLQRIIDDAQRCRDTVKELLEFARQSTYKTKQQDMNKAIDRTLFLLEKHAIFQNIHIERSFDLQLPFVPCDLQQMSHVFMNIVLNAAEAMEGEGRLTVTTSKLGEDKVLLTFTDTGPGIPEDVLSNIFDPFFTTKEEGKGTGLGLSVAYRIVNNHGGVLGAKNEAQGGSTFWIELPLQAQGEEEGDGDQ
ncbi:MAG: ATP-binding protein [Desulfovermiculus sp.]|nr:ATP-binding protein [Desulfovermiculus sp.]